MNRNTDCPHCGQNLELPADATDKLADAERVRSSWVEKAHALESERDSLKAELETLKSVATGTIQAGHMEIARWKAIAGELAERMKLINGPESKCCQNPESCANHALLRRYDAALSKEKR